MIFGVIIKAKLNLLSNFRRKIFTLRKYDILKRATAELDGNWLTNCLVDQILQSSIHFDENGTILTNDELVTTLNQFFLSVNEDVPPLDLHSLPAFLPAADQLSTIHPYQVCKKLLNLNPFKAAGPDNITPRILKEFAYELSDPLAEIFNLSLSSATTPSSWKSSNISPIPKETPPKEKNDLRLSTSCISKVLEEFVVEWILEDIGHHIDPKQFGCLRGSSSNLCLLDMFLLGFPNFILMDLHCGLSYLTLVRFLTEST